MKLSRIDVRDDGDVLGIAEGKDDREVYVKVKGCSGVCWGKEMIKVCKGRCRGARGVEG